MRNIQDILLFRQDISPFLVHLTRRIGEVSARARLETILQERALRPGNFASDARFGGNTLGMSDDEKRLMFGAVCLTDTPLSEVHCLIEIAARAVNLEPYGVVFLKDRLKARRVAPALYLNNEGGGADPVIRALFQMKDANAAAAQLLLPMVAVFGLKVHPPKAPERPAGEVDFLWEREWRYPAILGALDFDHQDVFCGLCPHDEIAHFEAHFGPVRFIDPCRNMKWYAPALIASRQRHNLKHSVV